MKNILMDYQTISGPIHGTCVHIAQVPAKFQIWARQVAGVTDDQSLAYLVCDKPETWPLYYNDEISMLRLAAECERRISLHEKPKDFGKAIVDGKICFAIVEVRTKNVQQLH